VSWLSILIDFNRKKHDFLSNQKIKQVKVGCLERIQMLRESISNYKNIDDKRSESLLNSIEIVKDLEGLQLIRYSMRIAKDNLEIDLNVINSSSGSEFGNLTKFLEDEIKLWLVTFVNDNKDNIASIQQLHSKFKEMEDEIFSL